MTVTIIGAGNVGMALARALVGAGQSVSRYAQGRPMMPVAGDDAAARQQVMALATLIGFDAIDMGPLSTALTLEPLAMVWIHRSIKQGQGRHFAFARMSRA